MKRLIFLITALSMILIGCTSKSGSDKSKEDAYVIPLLSVFSGDGAQYGEAAKMGVELAVNKINETGGVNGKKIEILLEDSKESQTETVSALEKLISSNSAQVIIGPFYSGQSIACAPIANRNKVVLISGSASSDDLKTAGDYFFRTCPSNDEQAKTLAYFGFNSLEAKTAYIVYRNEEYGVNLKDQFVEHFEGLGGSILGTSGVEPNATDLRTQLAKIKQVNPDIIFAAVHYTTGGNLLKQASQLNISSTILGTDGGFDPQLIDIAGVSANGSYWATFGWGGEETIEERTAFIDVFKKTYQKDPGAYSGYYYDAMLAVAEALKSSEQFSGEAIRKALIEMKGVKGVTGLTRFDEQGNVSKPFTVHRIIDNEFVEQ